MEFVQCDRQLLVRRCNTHEFIVVRKRYFRPYTGTLMATKDLMNGNANIRKCLNKTFNQFLVALRPIFLAGCQRNILPVRCKYSVYNGIILIAEYTVKGVYMDKPHLIDPAWPISK